MNASDMSHGLALDNINHKLYLTGGSVSTTYTTVLPSSGGYCIPTLNTTGWYDAFIARFNLDFSYVGINELQKSAIDNLVTLYPNPNTGNLHLKFNANFNGKLVVEIFDILGHKIFIKQYNELDKEHLEEINIANFSNGVYLVKMSTETYSECLKLIKQ